MNQSPGKATRRRLLSRILQMFIKPADRKQKKSHTSVSAKKSTVHRTHNADDGSQAYNNTSGLTYQPGGGGHRHHHGAGLPLNAEPMGDHGGQHANNHGGHHGDHSGGYGGYSGGNDSSWGGGGDSGGGGGGGGGGDSGGGGGGGGDSGGGGGGGGGGGD